MDEVGEVYMNFTEANLQEAAIRADERRKCAAAVCTKCEAGQPIRRARTLLWSYEHDDSGPCPASPIHAMEGE